MTNWLPIAGAALDGTAYDLWVIPNPKFSSQKGPGFRITNCKFFDGYWHEYGLIYGWCKIEVYQPTHYCEITPPQEPLSWPTESGWYWIKNIEGIQWRKLELLPDTDDERGRAFVIDQWVVYEDIATDWKFLPAPVPSFGDAP